MTASRPSRWKTISLTSSDLASDESDDSENEAYDFDAALISISFGHLASFLRLQALCIRVEGFEIRDEPKFVISWSAPDLRSLDCAGYLPSSSPITSSATTMTMIMVCPPPDEDWTKALLAFVVSTPTASLVID